jgi:hypothetical protein
MGVALRGTRRPAKPLSRPLSPAIAPLTGPATMTTHNTQPRHTRLRRRDCEDRLRGLLVVGCGLVTAGVTHVETGFVPLLRLVHPWLPAPAQPKVLA